MTTWARRERNAAKTLGVRRVRRAIGESAPDLEILRLPSGDRLQPEVKHRRRLPRLLVDALDQALRYSPDAVPLAIVSEHGGRQLAVLRLVDFARLVGIEAPSTPRRRPRRRAPKASSLLGLLGALELQPSPDGAPPPEAPESGTPLRVGRGRRYP